MLPTLETTHAPGIAKHSLVEGWEHIEAQAEVARVLERIRTTARFDVYKCAEDYEMAYTGYNGDDEFYEAVCREGKYLYVGVGTGKRFCRMLEANSAGVGLDNSPEMLKLLRSRYPHITQSQLLLADAIEAPVAENQFDTVVAPYSFLQVLPEEKMPQFLQNVHHWLKPGGRFYTDTFSPYLIQFQRKGLETSVRSIATDTRIAIHIIYDHQTQNMMEYALIDKAGDAKVLEMPLHYYFPHEVVVALKNAGFAEHSLAGGYKGEPFDPTENEVIVYEARKAPAHNGVADAHRGNGQMPSRVKIPS